MKLRWSNELYEQHDKKKVDGCNGCFIHLMSINVMFELIFVKACEKNVANLLITVIFFLFLTSPPKQPM